MSPRLSFWRSPKPGALTARTLIVPRSLLTARVARASPSKSPQMMHEVLGDLEDLLEHGQDFLHRAELLVGDEDVGVLDHRLHPLRVGHEVGADVAAVERHAVDVLDLGLDALGLLDGDDAVLADLLHALADQVADGRVVVGGDRRDLRHLVALGDLDAVLLDGFDERRGAGLEAALQAHRVRAGGHVLQAFLDDRLAEHGRGGGAVTGDVVGLGGDLLGELGADVLERVFELDVLGDGDAVVGDGRGAELLVEHDVAALGAERDLDGVGEGVDAALQGVAGLFVEEQLLGHVGATSRGVFALCREHISTPCQ